MASGLDKVVANASIALGRFEAKTDTIFYGDKKRKGIYDTVKAINEVDICNIVNYYLSKVDIGLIRDPKIQEQISRVKKTAQQVNDLLLDFTTYPNVANSPRTPESISNQITVNQSNKLGREKISNLTSNLKELSVELIKEIPAELITVVPSLGRARTSIEELTSILSSQGSLENIPNSEVQKIVSKVYDLQAITSTIASLNSAQSVVNLLNTQKQIQKLQKFLNPARIAPTLKQISNTLRTINQVGLQILKILSFIKVVIKVMTALVKAFKIILIFFKTLPLPSMFVTHGVTDTLIKARQVIDTQLAAVLKTLKDLSSLITLVYDFILELLNKIQLVDREIQILLLNLQNCTQVGDLANEIAINAKSINTTVSLLKQFTDNYKSVVDSKFPKQKVGNITITVIEEELVDEGKTLKRRRAVAYNERGLVIAQGDLTFATDSLILIEELKLKLANQGIITSLDISFTFEEQSLLDSTSTILNIDELEEPSDSIVTEDMVEVQGEITSFIDGLKNGKRLRKIVRKKLTQQTSQLKSDLKASKTASENSTSGSVLSTNRSALTQKYLSEQEKTLLRKKVRDGLLSRDPVILAAAQDAKRKLEADSKARAELAGG